VHIRKRADEDCTSDCLDYSGWTDDGHMQCENENDDVADTLEKRSLLAKRSRKTAKYVKKCTCILPEETIIPNNFRLQGLR
jgi:hypothetical protein